MKKEAMLYKQWDNDRVQCQLCSHYCKIDTGDFGFCNVRQNIDGRLYTLVFGEAVARNIDPIEKKPLYHFYPGSLAYSVATRGCNFHCGFCQNWQISFTRKENSGVYNYMDLPPEKIVQEAKANSCQSIAYTYTEPTIFFEYAYETAKIATQKGLSNVFVSNGYMSKNALEKIAPFLNAINVDLKSFRDDYYQSNCEARLKPVLNSIRNIKELGIWLEITTLIIPGENDSREELEELTQFIAEVGKDIPWHISRFHPAHEFKDHSATPMETLEMARETGRKNGLNYIYIGNVPAVNHTYCAECGKLVVQRVPGQMAKIQLKDNHCPGCNASIPGVWS